MFRQYVGHEFEMKILNVLGRILCGIFSVIIMISVFITTVNMKFLNIELNSMSLFEYNRTGSVALILLAAFCLVFSYFNRGFIVSLLSIVILVLVFYTATTLNTGSNEMDTMINKISFVFGDVFSPQAGFLLIIICSVLLFLVGLLIRATNKKMNDKGIKMDKI